jgi:hypothetical protein
MMETINLGDLAHARSGDKGNHANIGVVAYSHEGYEHLRQHLTAERVAEYFTTLQPTRVERFELPNLWSLNFVLYDCLAGALAAACGSTRKASCSEQRSWGWSCPRRSEFSGHSGQSTSFRSSSRASGSNGTRLAAHQSCSSE